MLSSYSSIFNLGHVALAELFSGDVLIEEKIDGSQFSFGLSADELKLECRSRGKEIDMLEPEKMFSGAVATVCRLRERLVPGWIYRGEVISKPKHNVLKYATIPPGEIILFDVDQGGQDYLDHPAKAAVAAGLGLMCVPALFVGRFPVEERESFVKKLLETPSVLGGTKIEGFVIKNYKIFGRDKKTLMGKCVSESFKESHRKECGEANPSDGDFCRKLGSSYATTARWRKAVQHLAENGELKEDPGDIGKLMTEIRTDVLKEHESEIKDALYRHYEKRITKYLTLGFPEWYKDNLMKRALGHEAVCGNPEETPKGL